uniref:Zinc finger AN1 domain-containing stress-associated protein 15 n=1 Tax=Anthurium amnicola TaxID=1678845 RepID=A0A1D1YZM5_9ARAE
MARESCNLDKEEAEILKPPSPSTSSPTSPAAAPTPPLFLKPSQEPPIPRPGRTDAPTADPAAASDEEEEDPWPPARSASRCSCCRRRVGLTGFRCRCGDLFCSRHRHSDTHDCSFDYKAAAREEISKANPLIRAAKIIKI